MTVPLIALGAAIGAPLRYLTDRTIQARHNSVFECRTLAVNMAGSLLLGFLVGLAADAAVVALAGTAFCGTLATFSTLSYETLRLPRTAAASTPSPTSPQACRVPRRRLRRPRRGPAPPPAERQ